MTVRYYLANQWNTIPGNVRPEDRPAPCRIECDNEAERPTDFVIVGDMVYCIEERTTYTAVSTDPVLWEPLGSGQPGPPGPPGPDSATFTAENKDTSGIKAGQPVAIHSSGVGVVLADATGAGKRAVGLATEDIDVGFSGEVQVDCTIEVSDWTAATGSPLLPVRSNWYLDTTPGTLTQTAPGSAGNVVQEIMSSLSTVKAKIGIGDPILL